MASSTGATTVADSSVLARITDSSDSSVGGGSAAALAGSMAASLAAMVARVSESGAFGLAPEQCRALAVEGDSLSRQLLQGAEEDAQAYGLLAAAYRRTQTGPESARARDAAIQRAAIVAATVPRDNARMSRRVLELCDQLEGRSNSNACSDLAVARVLADAALSGCVLNIVVNLPLIHDAALANELSQEATRLRATTSPEPEAG